ncbi:MAG TPA: DUF4139 domain-containing protein [Polyangiaceae bacterium]
MRYRAWLLCFLACGACAGPNVTSGQLPLRRVVIYRNGVGYFERSGTVNEERVTFDMQQRMVGDFLASLAIIERGGSSVRSASFPLDLEDTERPGPPNPPPPPVPIPLQKQPRGAPAPPAPEKPEVGPKRMRSVVLHLDGERHDLTIGYLAETPVWRPSYRVVVHADGTADLQVWGIVQNLSGEDWNDVALSLVAGAPLAFQSTLGTPVVPERPVVSDQGEIIAAVPQGVTSLDKSGQGQRVERVGPEQEQKPAAPAAQAASAPANKEEAEEARDEDLVSFKGEIPKAVGRSKKIKTKVMGARGTGGAARAADMQLESAAAPAPAAPPPPRPDISAPRRIADLAAVALESGTTRYDIPKPVTVPNKSATMVLLASQRVPGESVFLFSPDPGVMASASHPFRVARFTNSTRGLLEGGPIAVFERGSFLGQGLLDPLPRKATATVPFALERSVALIADRRYDQRGARLYRIEASQLWIERDEVTRTTYKVDYGAEKRAKLLVRHPRLPGTRLYKPPQGTDDDAATSTAMVPVELRPHSKLELTVDERRATQQQVDWLNELADQAVRDYLSDARKNADIAKKLGDAWVMRDSLRKATDEQRKLQEEQRELERSGFETRQSLKAIEKNAQAADLRAKLTKRLTEIMTRQEQVTKRLIEVGLVLNEQQVRFRDAIRDIRLEGPLTPKN